MKQAFPYWTYDQVRRTLEKAIAKGILVKGNYNKTQYDRTCWYAFTDEVKFGIRPKRQMDLTKTPNRSDENAEPIPDTKTDTEKDTTTAPSVKDVVVVPSFLLGIEKLPESKCRQLMKLYTDEVLERAVKVLRGYGKPIPNPYGFIKSACEEDWKPHLSVEERTKIHIKWWDENCKRWEKQTISNTHITRGPTYVEFLRGGVGNCMDYLKFEQADFKDKAQEIIGKLLQKRNGEI